MLKEKANTSKSQKNWIAIILVCMLCLGAGFILGKIIKGSIYILPKESIDIPFYSHVLIFLGTYFLSVLTHELTHLIAFKAQGFKIRAFIIGIFAFIHSGQRVKLKLNVNTALLSGGMVIPMIPEIKNEHDLRKAQKIYSNAIISAPIFSAVFGILFAVVCALIMPYLSGKIRGIVVIGAIWIVLFSCIINLSSLIKTPMSYGDYPAFFSYRKDPFFTAVQLYSYLFFMEDSISKRINAKYLKNYIIETLEIRAENFCAYKSDLITVSAIDMLLVESLIGFEEKHSVVFEFCEYYISNPQLLTGFRVTELHKILFIHILYWMKLNNYSRLYELVDLSKDLFFNKKIQNYYNVQISQIIYGEDNHHYLSNKSNIKNTSLYTLWRLFDGYYEDEIKLNQS